MRKFNALVFDEFIPNAGAQATTLYTSQTLNERLGAFDMLTLMAVADNVTGAAATMTVQLQHSADGRNWGNKNQTAEINNVNLSTTAQNPYVGSDAGSTGSLGFVRLAVTIAANSSAHVRAGGRTMTAATAASMRN